MRAEESIDERPSQEPSYQDRVQVRVVDMLDTIIEVLAAEIRYRRGEEPANGPRRPTTP